MRFAYLLGDQGIPYLGMKGASVHARAITQALCDLGHDVTCFAASLGSDCEPPAGPVLRSVAVEPFLADLGDLVLAEAGRAASGVPPEREIAGLCLNDAFRRSVVEDHELRPPSTCCWSGYSLWSCAGAWLARELGVPLVLEVNSPLLEEQARYRALRLALRPPRPIRRLVFRDAAAVLAVSDEVAESAVRAGAPTGARGHGAERLRRPSLPPG